ERGYRGDLAQNHVPPRMSVVREEQRRDRKQKADEDALRPSAFVVRGADGGEVGAREEVREDGKAQRDHADDELDRAMVDFRTRRLREHCGSSLPGRSWFWSEVSVVNLVFEKPLRIGLGILQCGKAVFPLFAEVLIVNFGDRFTNTVNFRNRRLFGWKRI